VTIVASSPISPCSRDASACLLPQSSLLFGYKVFEKRFQAPDVLVIWHQPRAKSFAFEVFDYQPLSGDLLRKRGEQARHKLLDALITPVCMHVSIKHYPKGLNVARLHFGSEVASRKNLIYAVSDFDIYEPFFWLSRPGNAMLHQSHDGVEVVLTLYDEQVGIQAFVSTHDCYYRTSISRVAAIVISSWS